jgi:hypothetical protein
MPCMGSAAAKVASSDVVAARAVTRKRAPSLVYIPVLILVMLPSAKC